MTITPKLAVTTTPYAYGRMADAVVVVIGHRVYNPGFPHTVRVWKDGSVTLMSGPAVIATHDGGHTVATTVTWGDIVTVDGTDYVVTARPYDNPILVPVQA